MGESEPSRSSDIVLAQDEPGRPIIDLSNLKDITVRAGEPFEIKVPYSHGNPKPSAEFINGTSTVHEDDRIKIEVCGCHS